MTNVFYLDRTRLWIIRKVILNYYNKVHTFKIILKYFAINSIFQTHSIINYSISQFFITWSYSKLSLNVFLEHKARIKCFIYPTYALHDVTSKGKQIILDIQNTGVVGGKTVEDVELCRKYLIYPIFNKCQ